MTNIKQGDIWLIDFNPVIGSEMKKLRPAIVLNRNFDIGLDLKIVVPLTSWKSAFKDIWWLHRIKASKKTGLDKDSGANCYQIRCVSDLRFEKKLGIAANEDLDIIADIIWLCIEPD